MAKRIGLCKIKTEAGYTESGYFVKLAEKDTNLPPQTKRKSATIATSGGQPVDVLANPYGQPIRYNTPDEATKVADQINSKNQQNE